LRSKSWARAVATAIAASLGVASMLLKILQKSFFTSGRLEMGDGGAQRDRLADADLTGEDAAFPAPATTTS